MIYLPWIAFGFAIWYMIYQGDKARKDYLRRKADEKQHTNAAQHGRTMAATAGMTQQLGTASAQSQTPDPGKTYGFAGGMQK
jgi:hypothetical protein